MKYCNCGYRMTAETYLQHRRVHCAGCKRPLSLDLALYTAYEPFLEIGLDKLGGTGQAVNAGTRTIRRAGRGLTESWFGARPWR